LFTASKAGKIRRKRKGGNWEAYFVKQLIASSIFNKVEGRVMEIQIDIHKLNATNVCECHTKKN